MVQLLMLAGADKDALGNRKWTFFFPCSLQWAYGYRSFMALLAGGAEFTLGGACCYMVPVTAREGHLDTVRAVIKHGADVDAADLTKTLHSAPPCCGVQPDRGDRYTCRSWGQYRSTDFLQLHTSTCCSPAG